jgi:hydroxyethylthiazole kinase-like uncharacterized protein yjeF
LRSFAGDPDALFERLSSHHVLTPHWGEFAALFADVAEEAAPPVEAARTASVRAGCVIVLKGGATVIAEPRGKTVINLHASPWLGTGGAGDVLSGLITGLLAQGLEAFTAAVMAVWLHGDASLRAGPAHTAEDLIPKLAEVWAALLGEER